MTPHELTSVPVGTRITNGDRTLTVIRTIDAGSAGGVLLAVVDPDSFGVSNGHHTPKNTHVVCRYLDEKTWTIWTKNPDMIRVENAEIVSAINAHRWEVEG